MWPIWGGDQCDAICLRALSGVHNVNCGAE